MTNTRVFRVLSLLACSVLIAASALLTTACNDTTQQGDSTTTATATAQEVGQGATQFSFSVTDKDGMTIEYLVNTDKATVGDALQELGLIAGEEGAYGLYVKTVTGITVDYDTDGKYWAFYVNGAYASGGVDTTTITAGDAYAFKVE